MKMRRMGDKPGIKTIAARVKKPKKAVNIMYQCEYPQSPAERNNLLPLANWP